MSPEKIAEKFNLSIRTVYRDIKALDESAAPVSCEQGRSCFIVNGYNHICKQYQYLNFDLISGNTLMI